MKFEELDIVAPILRAVEEKGYAEPTPIQQEAIPVVMAGKDIFGIARTGTGKTAAFAIPIIQQLMAQREQAAAAGAEREAEESRLAEEQAAHKGYKAELYKIIYQDGVETDRVKINSSSYEASPAQIVVGPQ